MATSLAFLLFGVIVVAAIFSMAKIQRADARAKRDEADEIERKRQARLAAFRAAPCAARQSHEERMTSIHIKSFRPDGD